MKKSLRRSMMKLCCYFSAGYFHCCNCPFGSRSMSRRWQCLEYTKLHTQRCELIYLCRLLRIFSRNFLIRNKILENFFLKLIYHTIFIISFTLTAIFVPFSIINESELWKKIILILINKKFFFPYLRDKMLRLKQLQYQLFKKIWIF